MTQSERIKKDVVDNLYWDNRVDASDVKVEVSDEKVTLTGTVPSYTAKSAATANVWSIQGITDVDNQLNVKYPRSFTIPTDAEIKNNVESSLLWDTDIDSSKIEVKVNNNIVTLEGTVDAYWKRYRAETLADTIGVFEIRNKLAVVPSEEVEDEVIAKNVIQALTRNLSVSEENIEVEVSDSKVTLSGTASSWTEYRAAEDSAFFTAGVKSVNNLIKIES